MWVSLKIRSKINVNVKDLKKNKVKLIIFILAMSFVFVVVWFNRNRLSADNITGWLEGRFLSMGIGEGYPCELAYGSVESSNFSLVDNDIVTLSNTAFTVFNSTAKQMTNRPHNLSNPMMKTNGGRAILYDMGGKKYSIDTISKNVVNGSCENEIISGAVSENGVYGLITESKDYLSEMIIFDKSGKEKYKYYFSDHYISDISINQNGTNAVVCGFASEQGKLKSVVYIFNFNSDAPIQTFEYEENVIMSIEYMENGNIAVVGDKSTGVINLWTKSKQDFDYEKKILTSFEVNKYNGIVLSLSSVEGGENCEIVSLDRSGNAVIKIPTKYTITSITRRGNRIAGISGDKVFAYKLSGDADGCWTVANNIKKLQLRSTTWGYALGVNKIYKVHLK